MKRYSMLIVMHLVILQAFSQEKMGYGLVLPTEEQLKRIPYVPGFALPPNVVLPRSYSLKEKMPLVGSQGYQGSCTAWAISYAVKSFHEKRQRNWSLSNDGIPDYQHICSPSFVFNIGMSKLQDNNCLNGIPFELGFTILRDMGTSFWEQFPYNEKDCSTLPSTQIINAAGVNKISLARAVNAQNATEIKYNLFSGNPIVIGVALDDFFQPDGFAAFRERQYFQYIPKSILTNYHAMVCIGYNEDTKCFQVQNSYSTAWGNDGYVDIPYSVFPQVVKEAYIVYDAYTYASAVNFPVEQTVQKYTSEQSGKYQSWLKLGDFREFKNIRLTLVAFDVSTTTGTILFTDVATNKELNKIEYNKNIPQSFYVEEQRITLTLIGSHIKGLGAAANFILEIDNTVDYEFLNKASNIINFKDLMMQANNLKMLQSVQEVKITKQIEKG